MKEIQLIDIEGLELAWKEEEARVYSRERRE
jgi:hypothetical protein